MTALTLPPSGRRALRRQRRGALAEAILDVRWKDTAVALADRMWDDYSHQRDQAEIADTWLRAENERPVLPEDQWAPDYKALQEVSPSAYIRVAIAEMTQCLYVEGHLPGNTAQAVNTAGPARSFSDVWSKIWQPNRMDGRQIAVHRGALAHGVSYVVAEKAKMTFSDEDTVSLRGVSALSGCALWRTTEVTEFPEAFIEVRTEADDEGNEMDVVQVYDERYVYILHRRDQSSDRNRNEWIPIDRREHGASVCPVVAFCNDEDLDGNVMGEIRPVIPVLKRIDQDSFDRLIVQRFGSWRIRTATGIELPDNDSPDAAAFERFLAVNSLLTSDNEKASFGTLEPTALDGYIAAKDSDLRDFAAILQVPPHHILGLSPNVSAEGLVEAQASLMRKMEERQHLFGESWELLMRLAAHIMGMREASIDFSAQVTWRDMESRSLAQIADALFKLSEILPPELLWNRLPNWTQQDTEMAIALREKMRQEQELVLEKEAEVMAAGAPPSGGGGGGLDDAEQRRINRMRGGHGPDWDNDGKPN